MPLPKFLSKWSEYSEKGLREVVRGILGHSVLFKTFGKTPDVSHSALVKRYESWVYACVKMNSDTVASVPLRLYATRGTGQSKSRATAKTVSAKKLQHLASKKSIAMNHRFQQAEEVEEILEHPFLDVMRNVNIYSNQFDHVSLTSIFLDLTGNCYWHLEEGFTPVDNLFVVPSQHMRVIPDEQKFISGYVYGNYANRFRFEPEEVIHFKMPNPNDLWYGYSPLQAAIEAVDHYKAMDILERSLAENNGRPDFVVKYNQGKLTSERKRQIERQWRKAIRGFKHGGNFKVLDTDFDIQELGFNPKELNFIMGRKWRRLEICDIFGVPVALLDSEKVNRANHESAMRQYTKFTIEPRLARIEQKINEQLINRYENTDNRLFVAFDSSVPEDRDEIRADQKHRLENYISTVNEVREELGMDPVAWGDEPISPSGAPILLEPPEDSNDDDDKDDDEEGKGVKKNSSIELKDEDPRTGGPNPPLSTKEREVSQVIRNQWRRQRKTVVENFSISSPNTSLDYILDDDEEMVDELIPHFTDEARSGTTFAIVSLIGLGVGIGLLASSLRHPKREDEENPVEPTRREVADAFIERSSTGGFIRRLAKLFAKTQNEVTYERLHAAVKEGMDAGEGLAEIKKRLQNTFEGFVDSKRADAIARTETARLSHKATIETWKESGLVSAKIWDASNDACPFCLEMHGKTIALDQNFFEKGDRLTVQHGEEEDGSPKFIHLKFDYDSVIAPPLHPNCRCTVRAKLVE